MLDSITFLLDALFFFLDGSYGNLLNVVYLVVNLEVIVWGGRSFNFFSSVFKSILGPYLFLSIIDHY